jgi:hypothetical protein
MNVFLFHILPIIHAYNADISWLWLEDAASAVCLTPTGRYDSGRISQLWLHFLTVIDVTTPVAHHNSGQ